jgi:hypothetical protein
VSQRRLNLAFTKFAIWLKCNSNANCEENAGFLSSNAADHPAGAFLQPEPVVLEPTSTRKLERSAMPVRPLLVYRQGASRLGTGRRFRLLVAGRVAGQR